MDVIVATQLLGNKPGKRIGLVKFYESGYYPSALDKPEYTDAQVKQVIAKFNDFLPENVARSAADASMFGWHTPAAQPAIEYFKQLSLF